MMSIKSIKCCLMMRTVLLIVVVLVGLVAAQGGSIRKEQETPHAFRRAQQEDSWEGSAPMDEEGFSGDVASASENSNSVQAKDLDFFKNIDPEVFEWLKPDEIVPGAYTCGFLHAPLGSLPEIAYPKVKVYICVQFAANQPASMGNLFVHCGGPESITDCLFQLGSPIFLGEEAHNNHNVIAIDQRGMGRSWPSMAHIECAYGLIRNETGGLVEVSRLLESAEPLNVPVNVDPFSEESIRNYTTALKERVLSCWTCETCDFQLNATQEDGSTKRFHFLEFSGTKQLVEDMNRFRQAIGAEKLSLYGISYGTQVMATFATLFPDHVDKFVVDSNTPPTSNIYQIALEFAAGLNERIDYLIFSCSARNTVEPGSCPVADMRACINDFNSLYENDNPSSDRVSLASFVEALYNAANSTVQAADLCDAAASGDATTLEELLGEILEEPTTLPPGLPVQSRQFDEDFVNDETFSFPTGLADSIYENPDYYNITSAVYGGMLGWLVLAQDWSEGAIYDEEFFIRETFAVNQKYTGAGTGMPAQLFALSLGHTFYWPRGVPLPPRGNPFQTGIVSGQLYDSGTPYTMTQATRQNFMSTNLLTSQSIGHGLVYALDRHGQASSCQNHIKNYLATGIVGFVDGTTCGSEFADECSFESTFGLCSPGR